MSLDVAIAVAKIEKIATKRDSPANLAALGAAYLVSGDLDRSVDTLTEAASIDPSALYQSDLAAAYLARARSGGPSADWAEALAAADRGIARDPSRREAYFNRALALEGLHLNTEAIDAWRGYSARDASSPWAAESLSRAAALEAQRRRREASDVERLKHDHQAIRERIEDDLLAQWGDALLGGDNQAASRALAEAATLADSLAQAGGDAMPRDEIKRIVGARDRGGHRRIRELAIGHQLYGTARRHYLADRQERASEIMKEAARHLAVAQSPYALWAPVLHAVWLRNNGAAQAAVDQLHPLLNDRLPDNYYCLRGRIAWTEGVGADELGRYDVGRQYLSRAVEIFQQANEVDNLIATRTILADAEWFLGDDASAWTDIVSVSELVDALGSRRDYHLWVAATMALDRDIPEAALELQNARVQHAVSPRSKVEAYIHRSRTLAQLGKSVAAAEDLDRASELLTSFTDTALKQRNSADVKIGRAELLSRTDARRAIDEANEALEYVPRADPAIRLATLLALRATCKTALNDVAGARSDLLAAIEAFEHKRNLLGSQHDRLEAFQQERSTFKQLLRLEVEKNGDWTEALRIAERGRARVLLENWRDATQPKTIDPAEARTRLDPAVAVVYFETLPDRVLMWVLTKEGTFHFSQSITRSSLDLIVGRLQRVIQKGGSLEEIRPHSTELYRQILEPALRAVVGKTTLILVPDGPLYAVPFSALSSTTDSTPLVARFAIGMAPSLTAYLVASARLAHADFDSVVAIGDGHSPSKSQLPVLPMANQEARAVGNLYPQRVVLTGGAATKHQILSHQAAVIHFSGHTIVNVQHPMMSKLLLAPDPDDNNSDGLLMSDITRERFGTARVVTLATCDGAAGHFVEGEGVVSVARAFFAAGVPSVVASLWQADDNAMDLLTAFHRELRVRRDAVAALRAAQLLWLRDHHERDAVRAWAGYVALGGTMTLD